MQPDQGRVHAVQIVAIIGGQSERGGRRSMPFFIARQQARQLSLPPLQDAQYLFEVFSEVIFITDIHSFAARVLDLDIDIKGLFQHGPG